MYTNPLDSLAVRLSEQYEWRSGVGAPVQSRSKAWFLGPDRCAILWACAYLTARASGLDAREVPIDPVMVANLTGHSEANTKHKLRGLASKGWLSKLPGRPIRYRIEF